MKPWQRIEPTKVMKVGWRTIVTKTFRMPDGSVSDFQTYDIENRDYVAVIALTPDKQVIVARQFRAGPEKIMVELPGGGVDRGESPEQAVKRELREETCYEAEDLVYLGFVYKDEKFNARHHYFFATGCTLSAGSQKLDTDEFIEVGLITIDELINNAKSDAMTDGVAVLMAYDHIRPYIARLPDE